MCDAKVLAWMNRKKEELFSIIEKADDRLIRMLLALSKEYQNEEMEESNPLYRLVYTSARSKHCDDKEVEKILEASRSNNAKLGITGILIHTEDRFLQVLEGEKEKINWLYNKLEKDDRHGGSVMRFCEPVDTRYFEGWDMAGKKVSSTAVDFNTSISDRKKELYNSMLNGDLHSYKDEGMRVLKTFLMFS